MGFALSDEMAARASMPAWTTTEGQIEEYRKLLERVRDRRKQIEEAPEKTENVAEVLDDLRQEAGLLRGLISQVQEKYPLNLLPTKGCCPTTPSLRPA